MVLFISDSCSIEKAVTAPLTQGYEGLIWATDAEQAQHASSVLASYYMDVIIDDHNGFTTTDYVEMTARLRDSVTRQYNIDRNYLYATGQLMGCMTLFQDRGQLKVLTDSIIVERDAIK
jgi:predicted peptidase